MHRTKLFLPTSHVAIVGGGTNAVSFLYEILKHAKQNKITSISIFEKNEIVGPGKAWRVDQHSSLTSNDPLGGMILFKDKPNDYSQWFKANAQRLKKLYPDLEEHIEECATGRERYSSRKIFGLYVIERFNALLVQANDMGIKINVHNKTEIVDINKENNGNWQLTSHNKQKFLATNLILASGPLPSDKYINLKKYPNYHPEGLEEERLGQIKPEQDVIILGSNVTAVDAVKLLMEQKHEGNIYIVSPSGHMPRIKGRSTGVINKLQVLTPENLDKDTLTLSEVLVLTAKEISQARGKSISVEKMLKIGSEVGEDALATLQKELKRVESGEARPWQWIMGEIYFDVLPIVGRRLKDPTDQDRFLDVILPLYVKWMAGMTEDNARRMLKLMLKNGREHNQGQLQILHGPLNSPLYSGTNHKWQIKTKEKILTVDHLIDATGPGRNIELSPALASMAKNGFLQPHRRGGVFVNEKRQIINKDGMSESRAWATGQSTVACNPSAFGSIEWNTIEAEQVAPQIRSGL
ncbi:MAG: FAD/NAD(P)-binding protein [Gammaproteobacteria bacterium]